MSSVIGAGPLIRNVRFDNMSQRVQRFVVHACPGPQHPEYYSWQTAQICLFVGDDNRERAFASACDEMRRQHWLPIGPFRKETLIERRVLDGTPENLRVAYAEAKAGNVIFKRSLDQMPMATKGHLPVPKAPRIGEAFMDQVIDGAGGRRLTKSEADEEKGRNADYCFQDAVIELKDLQEEGLLVTTRQERLSRLLRPIASGAEYASLSPANLSETQWLEYIDILGRPIQNHVKSAAKQLKVSRAKLGSSRGGVIFLNTGYSSIPHELFNAMVHRYCTKDTRQVDFAICISSWLLTNGFESEYFVAFDPREGGCALVSAIREAFWKEEERLMAEWAGRGFLQDREMLQPIEPIAFSSGGVNFSTEPPTLPSELDSQWNKTEP
jgi:hypothetical protein